MSIKLKAAPPPDSDEDSVGDDDKSVQKRIRLMKQQLTEHERSSKNDFVGGIIVSSESQSNALSSTNASLSAAEKKGLKEVEELERELDLKNTFSRETNRRDEDAEMNKYIDEQIRQRRLAAEKDRQSRIQHHNKDQERTSELHDLFTLPMATAEAAETKVDDILLHQLVKNYPTTSDEKSEAMLSSQMLNGIPEVDLGMRERIKTIEATEEAKLRLASSSSQRSQRKPASNVPMNYSTNFQQHRTSRDKTDSTPRYNYNNRDSRSSNVEAKTINEPVVLVGEEPREIELRLPSSNGRDHRPPVRGRASDDYHLQKFKKNSRR